MLGPSCEVLLVGAGWDNSTLGAPIAAVHGTRVLMAVPMGLSSCWWTKHLALGYFQKKSGEEKCHRGMVAWAQPSGKLRLRAAQGTVQDLALAAQKHPRPPFMPMLQPPALGPPDPVEQSS